MTKNNPVTASERRRKSQRYVPKGHNHGWAHQKNLEIIEVPEDDCAIEKKHEEEQEHKDEEDQESFLIENERFRNVLWHDGMKQKFHNGLSVMGGFLVFHEFGAKGELDG
ncbi:hypothetical protein LguiB_013011 [Lonicera macranthoides]